MNKEDDIEVYIIEYVDMTRTNLECDSRLKITHKPRNEPPSDSLKALKYKVYKYKDLQCNHSKQSEEQLLKEYEGRHLFENINEIKVTKLSEKNKTKQKTDIMEPRTVSWSNRLTRIGRHRNNSGMVIFQSITEFRNYGIVGFRKKFRKWIFGIVIFLAYADL